MKNPILAIGSGALTLGAHTNGVLSLLFNTLSWIVTGPFRKKPVNVRTVFQQMVFAGVQSVVIVFFISLFTGIVIAMQSAYQLKELGAVIYVAPMVAISMARELGPVFTALVIAGRVGSAITAELGTMKVSEQIEALETLALDPVRFLVVPRFLALVIMMPCLTLMSDLIGIAGGFLVGVFNLKINMYRYISFSFDLLTFKDIWTGLIKSLVFGVVISMISCYVGLDTRGGAEGVGKATTLSVVLSFILIVLFDCVITGIFFFSNV
ncbi:MAG: MlaE family lipid ABC transporter permease subunit [Candidatus Omnitrophica bacterium]|nr:MlaE family lipid ABC transporter permease subunit [Candidatus Omnitrophota bacterium]